MDIGFARGLITVTLLVLFLSLWVWSWSKKRQANFDAAAQLPLEEDTDHPPADNKETEQDS